jgi:hypothetical protein
MILSIRSYRQLYALVSRLSTIVVIRPEAISSPMMRDAMRLKRVTKQSTTHVNTFWYVVLARNVTKEDRRLNVGRVTLPGERLKISMHECLYPRILYHHIQLHSQGRNKDIEAYTRLTKDHVGEAQIAHRSRG